MEFYNAYGARWLACGTAASCPSVLTIDRPLWATSLSRTHVRHTLNVSCALYITLCSKCISVIGVIENCLLLTHLVTVYTCCSFLLMLFYNRAVCVTLMVLDNYNVVCRSPWIWFLEYSENPGISSAVMITLLRVLTWLVMRYKSRVNFLQKHISSKIDTVLSVGRHVIVYYYYYYEQIWLKCHKSYDCNNTLW